MLDDPRNPKPSPAAPTPGARPGLRLVRAAEPTPEPVVANTPTPPKATRRSPFLEFMNAYADAVDQQVKVLLDV